MLTDVVKQVAGERAEVVALMKEGVDPHLYKPTRNDVRQLLDADIVFYCGRMLEGRMVDALTSVGRQGKPVHAVVSDGIDADLLLSSPEWGGHPDPHVWMDVSLWSRCVGYVARKLGEFDPQHAAEYGDRAARYEERLGRLHQYGIERIESIPAKQRLLVTAHDAFAYFSKAYAIPVMSAQGLSTESEASVEDINRLVRVLVERKIEAIFVESSVPQDNLLAVVEGAADRGWAAQVGGLLFSDAMGPAGTYEGTYEGMMDHNITTITLALGGEAPERGLNGGLGEPTSR
jgi:manganese/zinc/iron transport system substrate-binding protein